jgi:acyl-CoA thioesterase I
MSGRKPIRPVAMVAARVAAQVAAMLTALLIGATTGAAGLSCGAEASPSAADSRAPGAGDGADAGADADGDANADTGAVARDAAATAPDDAPLVVFLGDSLTAGYGLAEDQGFPAVIERTLRDEGRPIRIVNAGKSGDTSAGGLGQLAWLLQRAPDVLVVALGGNDGLRGLPPARTRENLTQIVTTAREQGVEVLLLGLRMPPNYGPDYTEEFERLYAEVAEALDVPLVPFMLEGVAGDPELNLPDGIHPTAEGQRIVAANVLPALRELLEARP